MELNLRVRGLRPQRHLWHRSWWQLNLRCFGLCSGVQMMASGGASAGGRPTAGGGLGALLGAGADGGGAAGEDEGEEAAAAAQDVRSALSRLPSLASRKAVGGGDTTDQQDAS